MDSRKINNLLADSIISELSSDFSADFSPLTPDLSTIPETPDFQLSPSPFPTDSSSLDSFFPELSGEITNPFDADPTPISSSDTAFQKKPPNKKRKKTPREKQYVNSETGQLLQGEKGNFFQDGLPYDGIAILHTSFKKKQWKKKKNNLVLDSKQSSFLPPSIQLPEQLTWDPSTPFPESPVLMSPYTVTDDPDIPTSLPSPMIDTFDPAQHVSTYFESFEEEKKPAIHQDIIIYSSAFQHFSIEDILRIQSIIDKHSAYDIIQHLEKLIANQTKSLSATQLCEFLNHPQGISQLRKMDEHCFKILTECHMPSIIFLSIILDNTTREILSQKIQEYLKIPDITKHLLLRNIFYISNRLHQDSMLEELQSFVESAKNKKPTKHHGRKPSKQQKIRENKKNQPSTPKFFKPPSLSASPLFSSLTPLSPPPLDNFSFLDAQPVSHISDGCVSEINGWLDSIFPSDECKPFTEIPSTASSVSHSDFFPSVRMQKEYKEMKHPKPQNNISLISSSREIIESWLEKSGYNQRQRNTIIPKIEEFEIFQKYHQLLIENKFTHAIIAKLLKHSYKHIEVIAKYLNNYKKDYTANPRPAWALSVDQLTKIVNHKGGYKNVEALIGYLDKHKAFYIQKTQPAWILSINQLIKVLKHHGGHKNLQAITGYLHKHQTSLTQKPRPASVLSVDQLTKIGNHNGGSQNLQAITDYIDKHQTSLALQPQPAWVLSIDQLTKIVNHNGGSQNLQAIMDYLDKNQASLMLQPQPTWVLAVDQLTKIVSHDGGSQNLQAITDYIDKHQTSLALQPQPGWVLSVNQLTKIGNHNGGSQNLQAITDYIDKHQTSLALQPQPAWVLSIDQLTKIVNHNGGSQNLQAITDYIDKHQTSLALQPQPAWVLSIDQLTKVVNHDGGSQNLQAIIDYLDKHQAYFKLKPQPAWLLSIHQLTKIVNNHGGSKNLQAITGYLHKYQASYAQETQPTGLLSIDQLIKIVNHGGGSQNLQAITDYLYKYQASLALRPQPAWILSIDQLIEISAHNGGSRNINFIITHEKQIKFNQIPTGLLVSILKIGKKGREKLWKKINRSLTEKNLFLQELCTTNDLTEEVQEISKTPLNKILKQMKIEIDQWLNDLSKRNLSIPASSHPYTLWPKGSSAGQIKVASTVIHPNKTR